VTQQPCIACGAESWAPHFRSLVRCGACGFIRAAELPSPEALADLYGRGYFEGEEYSDYLGDREVHRINFQRRLDRITGAAGRLESLYEIGCAYGLWLELAGERGIRAAGIDVSAEAVKHAREIERVQASAGSFDDAPIAPGEFGAYCMWDTLEHLAHPEAFVAKISRLLPAGGWFFATTGDIGSPAATKQGAGWRMIHPPTHLQYFSRDSVSRFLGRHGLRTVCIESEPMCRSLHGTLGGLKLFGRGPVRAAARLAGAIVPDALAKRVRFTLDLGDIMLVCARKD
jgi:SAM-dependent methyltransferase